MSGMKFKSMCVVGDGHVLIVFVDGRKGLRARRNEALKKASGYFLPGTTIGLMGDDKRYKVQRT